VYKLVALDLDNTLIDHDLQLRPRVKSAVAQAQARGVHVTIATGRGPSVSDQYADELGLTTPLICFQGGLIYDHRARRVLHETRLDSATVPLVVRLAQTRGWYLYFETPHMVYLPRNGDVPEQLQGLLRTSNWQQVDDFLADLPETPHKFLFSLADPAEREALVADLRAAFSVDPRLSGLAVVASHPVLVEALPRGLNKATGLAWLAESLGVTQAEVMAMGDNDNDAEMLRWAGLGVAMADSSPAALAQADWVAPSVAEDGVAVALERFVL
jgi:Cof subfamily protein (haloacid dehalogenase superfamily)